MITAIRPYAPQNKQQQNFGNSTNVSETAEHAGKAHRLLVDAIKGKFPKDDNNIKAVKSAIETANQKEEFGAASFLEELLYDVFKVSRPKQ